jgi:hypothetical protein
VINPARSIADMQAAASIADNLIGLGQTGLAQQVIGGDNLAHLERVDAGVLARLSKNTLNRRIAAINAASSCLEASQVEGAPRNKCKWSHAPGTIRMLPGGPLNTVSTPCPHSIYTDQELDHYKERCITFLEIEYRSTLPNATVQAPVPNRFCRTCLPLYLARDD